MRSAALLLPTLALALGPACVSAPSNEDWRAIGFRAPEQTFRTFQTALRADDADLAYDCLGEDLKRREGVIGLSFAIVWDEMLAERPYLRYLALGEVVETRPRPDGRVDLVVVVDPFFLIRERTLTVTLASQTFQQLWVGDASPINRYDPHGSGWHLARTEAGAWIQTQLAVPAWVDPDAVTEVRLGLDWKIDGFELFEAPTDE